MANGPQDVNFNWPALGVILSVLGGTWVILKSFFSFATHKELAEAIDRMEKTRADSVREVEVRAGNTIQQMEGRFDVKLDEIRKTMLMLHEDNRHARHEMRDAINAPILNLGAQVSQLREYLQMNRGKP